MKPAHPCHRLLCIAAAAAILTALLPPPVAAAQEQTAAAPAGRVIVKFRAGTALGERLQAAEAAPARERTAAVAQALQQRAGVLGQRHGLALRGGGALDERTQVVLAEGLDSAALARRLAADAEVEYAVVDELRRPLRVPSDPLYRPGTPPPGGPAVGQWYLHPPQATTLSLGTEVVSAIDAQGAWDITTGHPSVVVAVLDTGVRFDHPDLARKLLPGHDMVQDALRAGDGDGRDADASDPGDFVTAAEARGGALAGCDVSQSSWHGTRVAGLVGAATDNGLGMAGAGWQVRVLPVRVLGKCGGFDSDIVAGMRWAAGLPVAGLPPNPTPAAVLNLSLGGPGACSAVYRDAIAEIQTRGNGGRGTVIVAAAGNSAGRAVGNPANCPGVIGVAAVRHVGTKVGFSDIGPELSLAAPGGNCVNLGGADCLYPILSTVNTGTTGPQAPAYSTGADLGSVGTSFAAPLVSATAALMRTANRSLTPDQVRAALQASARPFPQSGALPTAAAGGTAPVAACRAPDAADQLECYCTPDTCGAGLLDARAAVAAVVRVEPYVDAVGAAQPGQPLTLTNAATVLPPGRSVVSRQWSLVDGGGIVALPVGSTADGQTLTLTPTGDGVFTVRLTVVDDSGARGSVEQSLQVGTGVVSPAAGSTDSGGGSGGGLSWLWTLGLLAAARCLRRLSPVPGLKSRADWTCRKTLHSLS